MFPGRAEGYVIKIRKEQWNHPVRFIAKDDRGEIIAAGTVPQDRPEAEFLVHQNVGFTVINVGEWTLIVEWT